MIELLLAVQDDDVPAVVISASTPQPVFPSEVAYSVTCGSIRHEITFVFEGREWAGLLVDGTAVDLETQAFPGYRTGTISEVVGYGRCTDGEEIFNGVLVEWQGEGRVVRYRIEVDDRPALLPF